jgi:alpha-beta hydrolase superfamily lysophospholipase
MEVFKRTFKIEDEWCVIHLPNKPNGFGVLLIGDVNHYVDEHSSLWTQHRGRCALIKALNNQGYTVFYSDLYGRNWGSPDAVGLARQTIGIVMKSETLNGKIHLLAEGMGALTVLELMENVPEKIRSTAMINPCLDLHAHLKREQDTKLFYKRLTNEIANAYHIAKEDVENNVAPLNHIEQYRSNIPTKIWHATTRTNYAVTVHSRRYEQIRKNLNAPISLTFHLPEKQFHFGKQIGAFYHKHEHVL